jgi:hypothetical protein
MDGKPHSGDGVTRNPFGDGKGATEKMGPSKAAWDYKRNPSGNGPQDLGANDFQKNPQGKPATKTGEDVRETRSKLDQKSAGPGGGTPDLNKDGSPAESFYKASPRPQGDANDIGAGTIGHPKKPFKLGK